jgi:hypothetical protein
MRALSGALEEKEQEDKFSALSISIVQVKSRGKKKQTAHHHHHQKATSLLRFGAHGADFTSF